jgi:hypothetical protein
LQGGEIKMISVGNLGGTLYKEDIPIIKFKFIRNSLNELEVYTRDRKVVPFEFWNEVNEYQIIKFFDERITPDTRQGLNESLAQTPIKYYYPERIIRYSTGHCIHDRYWLECDDDDTCWRE